MKEIFHCCACSEEFGVGEDFENEVWAMDFELNEEDMSAWIFE